MYQTKKLIILDADGTTIDAYPAIEAAFAQHGMTLGEEKSFQKRHHLFKYLGGLKEFPSIIKKNLRKKARKKIVDSLTDVYRTEARLYTGIPEMIQSLLAAPDIVVGLVTRNVTNEPLDTLRMLFARHGIDVDQFDFFDHVPLSEGKTAQFRLIRERFQINPARAYACGDEHKDFHAAIGSGMHPFMVSYGFEDHDRLVEKFAIPDEVISRSPAALRQRIWHAFDIPAPDVQALKIATPSRRTNTRTAGS
ncbi:HAD family hydrolase [Massilia soli]|uniref:phosphoglycolate phosphatase n=1 Tax=Massilia soli TaxID=2792854 RepID=A0ABS7SUC1_9BURK|nr:HAD hydrolase-like protein [Massilia soli]MBZ2209544.1 HAD hydrolase-like protein [Massilia soli]